jgi:hypothetical protein
VISGGGQDGVDPVISFHNVMQGRLERCLVAQGFTNANSGGTVGLDGVLGDVVIRDNGFFGPNGVRARQRRNQKDSYLASIGLKIEGNIILAAQRGIALDGQVMHQGGVAVRDNLIVGSSVAAISATGATFPGSPFDVVGNRVNVAGSGNGIVIGVDGARVDANDIVVGAAGQVGAPNAEGTGGDGIVLTTGLDAGGLDRGHVSGNRIVGLGGDGISIIGVVKSAMITQNVIDGVGGVGIGVRDKASVETLTISGNHLLNIMTTENADDGAAAIRVIDVALAQISGNIIRGVGVNMRQGLGRFGIQAFSVTTLLVSDNEILEIGPPEDYLGPAIGIHILAPFERAEIGDNDVRRHATSIVAPTDSTWTALQIGPIEGLRQRFSRKVSMVIADETLQVIVSGDYVKLVAASGAAEAAAVRSNNFESRSGRTPTVGVIVKGDCLLCDNIIVQTSPNSVTTAQITASATIANANRIRGPEFSLAINTNPKRVTVLGNIVQSGIAVGGAPLDPKWADLNVTGAP